MTEATKEATANEDEQKRAGRGGLAMLAANVYFLVTGFVQQPLLQRAIGLADYGALARVLAVSNVFNNVVVTSSIQGVSRVTAAAGDAERQAFRAALRVHLGVAALATALLLGAAPVVTAFQSAPEILTPLVVIAGVLAVYGVYAPLVGYLNGRRMFTRQASLNVVAATLRTASMIGVGWFFAKNGGGIARAAGTLPGMLGATVGTVLAATGVFLLALTWTGTGAALPSGERPAGVPAAREYVRLIVPVILAQLFVQALMQADIILLGRFLSLSAVKADGAVAPGGALLEPGTAANQWIAVYRACQLFAFLPFQFLFSVTQVLFPMLAKAKKEEGDKRVAELVSRGARIGAILCGLMISVIVAMPEPLIRLAYAPEVAASGAPALRVLVLGQGAFAMLSLTTTILVSLGRERAAMGLTALALALLAGACSVLVPDAIFGKAQLIASATAVLSALSLALVVGVITARRTAGAFVPALTALRVGMCVALAAFAGLYTPPFGKLATLAVAPLLGVAYLGLLVATRELGREDLGMVLSVVRRKKG
ncbi:MAG: lipopolysaccharide biosynthesis protein [Labilithrix sp.]|nr:lipopolysaccharide biosynthesis protein [Labilithrix sp.]MCW5815892.1 lipopolysaccharide biosynthesis protein [Labilithrix sp.]